MAEQAQLTRNLELRTEGLSLDSQRKATHLTWISKKHFLEGEI